MAETPPTQAQLPRKLMLAVLFTQGLALFLLSRAHASEVWPSLSPAVHFPLWTLVLAWPTLLLLVVGQENLERSFKATGTFAAVLALLGTYVGWQATPHDAFPTDSLVSNFVWTSVIAGLVALIYLNRWVSHAPNSYDALFSLSWRDFLTVGLAALLMLGVLLILLLWVWLFSTVGIETFELLIDGDWFLYPLLAVAFGMGVLVTRQQVAVVDRIASLLRRLARPLLPLALFLSISFLCVLPIAGFEGLRETGVGSTLLLWLDAFTLLLINAVYQTGRVQPFSPIVHRVLSFAIATLPVLCFVALYGILVLIGEYGLTVSRCWALTVLCLLTLFSSAYTWCIVRRRSAWPHELGPVNTVMGCVVLAVVVSANSPLLDFRSLSLASQIQRVENGEIDFWDFDLYYAKHHLARPGHLKMQALIEEFTVSDPELASHIREARPVPWSDRQGRPVEEKKTQLDDLWSGMTYRPESFPAPPSLRKAVLRRLAPRAETYEVCALVRSDLDMDGVPEYVLLVTERDSQLIDAWRYIHDSDGWDEKMLISRFQYSEENPAEILRTGEIELVPQRFRDLKIGELTFHADP